ncbi:TonB family protein [Erythrobacter sp. JK5]|uniref:TonB family protein n=1 Tax=Erythrobacter sp. JK5 TaxID=2829500 RepID=UPI001BA809F2|nr:TonB family protein [Erythrobacter sp. JK5]QUL36473.1 TonB family protein [Erythrobacter sp. JK5]
MNYVASARRPNPFAMLGALGVPATFGAVLIAGLAVSAVIKDPDTNPIGVLITPKIPDPPPPPPPEPDARSTQTETPRTQAPQVVTVPETQFDLRPGPPIEVGTLPELGNELITVPGPVEVTGGGAAALPVAPRFDPVAASPSNRPSRWITDRDYRPRWIREGRAGRAGFRLEISAAGEVTGCTITRSTGHAVLDAATCDLITSRAKFDPAKDSAGKKVPGSFSSSVNWEIPE